MPDNRTKARILGADIFARTTKPKFWKRTTTWAGVTVLVVLLGACVSTLTARTVAQGDAERARLAFHLNSTEIAATLRLAIQHEEDLVVSGSAIVSRSPQISATSFDRWAESVRAFQRYPELQALGLIVPVSASRLPSFAAQRIVNSGLPESRLPVGSRGRFTIIPEGRRPFYCLSAGGVVRRAVALLPIGLDYCAIEPALLSARDTGSSSYVPFTEGTATILGVQTPVYRAGAPLSTIAERRKAFVGWLAESLVPSSLLQTALQGHPATAVTFRYRAGLSHVEFSSGVKPQHHQSSTTNLHNGWSVETFGAEANSSVFADAHAVTLLIAGAMMSALVGVLLFVLGTGRIRALSLVREQTRELAHLALHDPLTGLGNRAKLIADAERMLEPGPHEEVVVAALFIDLDGFKAVNDKLGHAAGDELLQVIARRLRSVVRDPDAVGRLGGDEFVILIESAQGSDGADIVARRVVETVRQPITLKSHTEVVSVSASVGIALAQHNDAAALLRDADLALYSAKENGRNRYTLFDESMDGEALSASLGGEH